MPNLINPSYFIRDIKIPNAIGSVAVAETVNLYIAKYEPECLRKLLGHSFYQLLMTEQSPRMTDLIKGKGAWPGLANDETKDSLIAYYVYFFFEEAMASQSTGVATSITKDESAMNYSPADKMVAAWNNFSDRVRMMYDFLYTKELNVRIYPEVDDCNTYYGMLMSQKINYFGI